MARSVRDRWQRFQKDQRASLALISATLLPLVIGCAALAIDVGTIFADRRRTQSAADIAAIVATANIAVAANAATAAAIQNKYPASAVSAVELGVYTANAALSPQSRFVASGSTGANAVRVTMQTTTPLTFARFFTGTDHMDIHATATAARSAVASFTIGSRTVGINNGVLNALLGKMLGANLSLSLSDYNALLNTKVDVFNFWSQLATRVNLTGVTYDSLLSGSAKAGDLVVTLQKANNSSSITGVMNGLVATLGNVTASTPLSSIASVGPYSTMKVGQQPQTSVAVSALDMLSGIAQAANGTNQIPVSLALGLPGIVSASVNVEIGEQPQGVSTMAVGLPGVSAKTAQTRIRVALQLLGTPGVPIVNLPIYIEVARGTATLKSVSCGYPSNTSSTVTLAVTPGIVDAWIGAVTTADFSDLTSAVNPSPGTLVNLGAVTATGRAHATMGNTLPTNITFNYADIQAQTKRTVITANFTSSLTASLLGDLTVSVNVGPFGTPIPGLAGTVSGIISGAAPSIDQLLATVLAALGIGIGQADVWINGIRCDGAVLVN